MNRRDFLKAAVPAVAIPAIAITCKYEDDEKGEDAFFDPPHENNYDWPYCVYCYERGQGEWMFSKNIRGSFAPEREYMSFEGEEWRPYAGWMDGGKLHFSTFDDATDFVQMHVRAKDDINLIDSIYDIYYISRGLDVVDDAENIVGKERDTEIQVAHYWFNGDTGSQIHWEADGFNTNFSKIEGA